MLKLNRLTNYFIYLNKFSESDGDPHKTWQVINELILLINPAGLLLRN